MEVRQEILDMSIKQLEEKVFLDLTDKGIDEATAHKTIEDMVVVELEEYVEKMLKKTGEKGEKGK